ncbi:MAG: ABC transporter substrate-binding protein [Acidobacteriota bacterium]
MRNKTHIFPITCLCLLPCCRPSSQSPRDSINISAPYELDSLDPHECYRLSDYAIARHFYEPLVRTDAELKIRPCLARSWETPDPLTWVFHLEPAARFHSGRTLRPQDVVFSIERLARNPALGMRTLISSVEDVSAVGPASVRIRLRRPLGVFLNKLIFVPVIPEGSDSEALAAREDGTGPYRLVEWDRRALVRMIRNEDYWGRKSALQRVTFLLGRSPKQGVEDLVSGRCDLATCSEAALSGTQERLERYAIYNHPSIFVKYLGYDLAREQTPYCSLTRNPFNNRLVRQAIDLAIDRRELVAALGVSATPAAQPVPDFIFGYHPAMVPAPHDLARARSLLDQAGLGGGFEVTLHARQILLTPAELIQQQLALVGIRVKVESLPDPEFFQRLARQDASFFISRFGCVTGDASDVLEDCIHSPDTLGCYGGTNYGRYSNPEIDRAIEQSSLETDPQVRKRALQLIMETVAEERPWIPLYFEKETYALDKAFTWQPRNDNFILAEEIGIAPR